MENRHSVRTMCILPVRTYTKHALQCPYAALAKAFSLIEATTKRIEKTTLLTSLLLLVIRRSAPGDYQSLLQTVYLCINRVGSIIEIDFLVTNSAAVEPGLHWC